MQMDGDIHLALEPLHQGIGVIGQQQVGHILDADVICAHLDQFLGQLDEIVLVVHRADGVADGRLADAAVLLGELDGGFQVAHIVQRIENTDDIDAVFNGLAAELLHHVVSIMLIAQDVLAPEQHLQLGMRQSFFQLTKPVPGIFVQEAQAAIKGSAAPAFQGIIADAIQDIAGGKHILYPHTGSCLGLVGIAQDGIGDHKFMCHSINLLKDGRGHGH